VERFVRTTVLCWALYFFVAFFLSTWPLVSSVKTLLGVTAAVPFKRLHSFMLDDLGGFSSVAALGPWQRLYAIFVHASYTVLVRHSKTIIVGNGLYTLIPAFSQGFWESKVGTKFSGYFYNEADLADMPGLEIDVGGSENVRGDFDVDVHQGVHGQSSLSAMKAPVFSTHSEWRGVSVLDRWSGGAGKDLRPKPKSASARESSSTPTTTTSSISRSSTSGQTTTDGSEGSSGGSAPTSPMDGEDHLFPAKLQKLSPVSCGSDSETTTSWSTSPSSPCVSHASADTVDGADSSSSGKSAPLPGDWLVYDETFGVVPLEVLERWNKAEADKKKCEPTLPPKPTTGSKGGRKRGVMMRTTESGAGAAPSPTRVWALPPVRYSVPAPP
jgi:hypothetical protein